MMIDAHQDLAWNMATLMRDYSTPVGEIRRRDRAASRDKHIGSTLLGWDAYVRGRVAVVIATLFAAPVRYQAGEWDTQCYFDNVQAEKVYRYQLDLYYKLVEEHPDKFRLVLNKIDLVETVSAWQNLESDAEQTPPVGLVISMEGAEGVRSVDQLPEWVAGGVRLIGPAWSGTRFCGGTFEPGPLTKEGYRLLDSMADHDLVLDLSHMDEQAALQALDYYPGKIVATHANAKALLPNLESNRLLSDQLIRALIDRRGMIGVLLYNPFLDENWVKGMRRELVSIEKAADQIDYICQLVGDARHVGFGSDFDGLYGWESVPREVDTIADLHKLAPLLSERGYSDEDLAAIFGENWFRVLQSALP